MGNDNKKDIKERGILNHLYKKINVQLEKSFQKGKNKITNKFINL